MHNLTSQRRARMHEAASTNLLTALAGEHMSMLFAAEAKKNDYQPDNITNETSSLRETPDRANLSLPNVHHVLPRAASTEEPTRRDRLRRYMHLFHVGSQVILPIAFVSFGVFYFLIYPNVPSKGVCN